MYSQRLPGMPLWRQGWRSFQGFKENRRERPCFPNCKRARTIRSPSTWTGCFPVACRCFDNLVSEDVCKGFANISICLKYLILCNPHEKQGKQNLRILFTFSRVCGPPFDDPKGRWRRGGGINVPIILKFSTRRAEALNVKELVRQTGIVVTLSKDNENCFAEAGTTKTGETSSTCTSATDDQGDDLGDNNLLDN